MKNNLSKFAIMVVALPRPAKQFIALSFDVSMCVLAVWFAYYLRLGEYVPLSVGAFWATVVSICIVAPIFTALGLYRTIFRYSGFLSLFLVSRALGIYGLLYFFIFSIIGVEGVPRTVGIIQPILLAFFVGASRVFVNVWLGGQRFSFLNQKSLSRVLIYGAGATGRQLLGAINNSSKMRVVGFLDDDHRLHGQMLNGLPICNPSDMLKLTHKLNVSEVLLALPNIDRKRRNEILMEMRNFRVAIRTVPSILNLAQGNAGILDVVELDIDDLLGRERVIPDDFLLSINLHGKVVMVTGAGGSIGGELCRQILSIGPSKLLLIEQNEFALYSIHQELEKKLVNQNIVLVPILASVQDSDRMQEVISTWHPDTIYHAAAYKHVPLVEHNLVEGIKNNVFGTLCVAQLAVDNGVSNFVLVSTDKAVRPTNIMGASKRLAEMVLQALAEKSSVTKLSMVRFGNVLGSSGSVVPKFREQIRDGGPITLTHPDITRYFMTISEAAQLVIQAGAMAKGGDVFVLDMGQPVKIIDLAYRMIELSGFSVKSEHNPYGDIEVKIVGLRPGEKLFEELIIGDNVTPTTHQKIMKAREDFIPWHNLQVSLNALHLAFKLNDVGIVHRMLMQQFLLDYAPTGGIVDWVYLEQKAAN